MGIEPVTLKNLFSTIILKKRFDSLNFIIFLNHFRLYTLYCSIDEEKILLFVDKNLIDLFIRNRFALNNKTYSLMSLLMDEQQNIFISDCNNETHSLASLLMDEQRNIFINEFVNG